MRPPPALSHGARATADLLTQFGLHPDKSLGQHFLVDPNQVERIVRLSGVTNGDHVVEVGPGLGALTAGLVEAGTTVVAVEIDAGLVTALEAQFSKQDVRVVHADALTADWNSIAPDAHRWAMVANLPYNVATPLVLDVLDGVPQIDHLLVMVQHEVAERLAAAAGSPNYGLPSVKVAYWGSAELVARVPRSVFLPQPRVESALVSIRRDPNFARTEPIDEVYLLARTAFAQRRKMVRRSLRSLVDHDMLDRAGISPDERPERIDVDAWCRLAAERRAARDV